MSSGRTYWWAKDAAWWRRERIIALGEEFAAAGPAVIDWLSCEAKAQNDKGWVKAGYRAVAHGAFVEPVTVGHIVSRAVELGLLDEFSETNGVFTCRISGWDSDQVRVEATLRKRAERARKSSNGGGSSHDADDESHDASRDVTERPEKSPTGQDRTEVQPPIGPPKGGRDRDLAAYEDSFSAWAAEHFPGVRVGSLHAVVGFLRGRITPLTPDAIRDFCASNPTWELQLEKEGAAL